MDCFNAFGGEDGIEDSAESAIVITYRMGKRLLLRLQVPNDLARLLIVGLYRFRIEFVATAGQWSHAQAD